MTEQEKRERVREQAKHLYKMIQDDKSDKSMLINELARLMSNIDSDSFIRRLVSFATQEVWQEVLHASENSEDVEDGA